MPTDKNSQDKSINPENISKEELVSFLENIISRLSNLIIEINNDTEINLPNETGLSNLVKDSNKLLDNLTSQITSNNPESDQKNNQEDLTSVSNDEWDELLQEESSLEIGNISKKQTEIKSKSNNILITIQSLITRPIIAISLVTVVIFSIFIFNFFGTNSSSKVPQNIARQSEKIVANKLKEKTEIINKSSELIEPKQPSIVENPPTPEPELTPEQSLIASIQNQVAEITKKYADGLILAIEANFNNSYLIITINNSWYEITENEQNKLTQEILEKAQILDFYKLTIIDNQGNLIARNPVVGNEMIIVRR